MKRSQLKKNPKELKKTPLCKQSINNKKNAKEKQKDRKLQRAEDTIFYEKIWKDRGHRSDLTGNFLGNEIATIFFHHLLPKEIYPKFRHKAWNILLCEDRFHNQIEINPYLLPEELYDRFELALNNAKEKACLN